MSRTRIRRAPRKRNSAPWLLVGAGLAVFALLALSILPLTRNATTAAVGTATAEGRPYLLKWNGPITPTAAGVIVAQMDGLFAREGMTITLQAGQDDAEVATTVAADDHVIGQVTAYGFLKARTAGLPIVAFASSYATSSVELYALATTTLNAPADLAGKIISYKPDSEIGSSVEALIRTQQIPRSQIRMTETPASVEQLIAGRIDILPGRSEVEGESLRGLKIPFRVLNPAAFGVRSVGSVYIVSEQGLARHPDAVERFLSAVIEGWDAAYANLDRTVPLITKALDTPPVTTSIADFMNRQRSYIRPFGARAGELDLARWRELQDRLLAQRLISRTIDLREAVTFSLVPELYRTRLKSLTSN
jgi:ABC-type nitrate/sulfonate/bicarbonate transport system substrate-binding protein